MFGCKHWYSVCLQCGRLGFSPWVGKIPGRRERLPTPVFWSGELHRLYYSPWVCKESDMTERLPLSLLLQNFKNSHESESCTLSLCDPKFSRPEYWRGQPFPSPGDLPNPGIKPRSPTLQADSLPAEPQGKPKNTRVGSLSLLQQIFPTQE